MEDGREMVAEAMDGVKEGEELCQAQIEIFAI